MSVLSSVVVVDVGMNLRMVVFFVMSWVRIVMVMRICVVNVFRLWSILLCWCNSYWVSILVLVMVRMMMRMVNDYVFGVMIEVYGYIVMSVEIVVRVLGVMILVGFLWFWCYCGGVCGGVDVGRCLVWNIVGFCLCGDCICLCFCDVGF